MIVILAITTYILATIFLFLHIRNKTGAQKSYERIFFPLWFASIALHILYIYPTIFTPAGLNLNFFNALLLVSVALTSLALLFSLRTSLTYLGLILLPATSAILLISALQPQNTILIIAEAVNIHVALSLAAYSFLAIAATQSLLIILQDRQLKNKDLKWFSYSLPSLEAMESFLFDLIGIGVFLLSVSLISGFVFLDDMFIQHLAHKTILSIVAWMIFVALLWGKWKHGWRGKYAAKYAFYGFLCLFLAYFGSKFVLELILNKNI
jgi:ABC-type uncharacterized transport system permease subunit